MSPSFTLPRRVVYAVSFALLANSVLNILGISLLTFGGAGGGNPTLSPKMSNGELVRLPVELRQVALKVAAADRYGMHDDNDWASLTPLGHGFVHLGEDYYALSMYHQLHCLNSFRRMFNAAANNHTASKADSSVHALHCLTYLRQMVLCSADVTLEPARHIHFANGREATAAYGMGVTHQCKDWAQVREFAEDNYVRVMKGKGVDDFVATEASAVY